MICYKITSNTSHSFYDKKLKYKVGETYECDGSPIPHKNGFHVCKNVLDLLHFGTFIGTLPLDYTSYVVEVCGDYVEYDDKFIVTNKLKVLKLLTFDDVCNMYDVTSDLIHNIVFDERTDIRSYANTDNELIQAAIACCKTQFDEDILFGMTKSKYDIVRFLLVSRVSKPKDIQDKLFVLLRNDSCVITVNMIVQFIDDIIRFSSDPDQTRQFARSFCLETYERFKNSRMIKINMARSQFCRSLLYDKLANDVICKVRCVTKYPSIFGGNIEEFNWSDKE